MLIKTTRLGMSSRISGSRHTVHDLCRSGSSMVEDTRRDVVGTCMMAKRGLLVRSGVLSSGLKSRDRDGGASVWIVRVRRGGGGSGKHIMAVGGTVLGNAKARGGSCDRELSSSGRDALAAAEPGGRKSLAIRTLGSASGALTGLVSGTPMHKRCCSDGSARVCGQKDGHRREGNARGGEEDARYVSQRKETY